ncbi:MAG: Rho termination factor N-terminal domain-containing protein, partial [bacterium]
MAETSTRARRDSGDLSALLLPELKKIAANLGIEGASDMKKPDLIQAISDLQAANREAARLEREARRH